MRKKILLNHILIGIFICMFIWVLPLNTCQAKSVYPDLAKDTNATFIKYFISKSLISGFPDGTIRPTLKITRAEAINLAMAALAKNNALRLAPTFKDVPANYWAAKRIAIAQSEGYIVGYKDNTFRPNQTITKAEGISFILSLTKQELPNNEIPEVNIFDVKKSSWAANPLAIGLYSGMISFSDKVTRKLSPDSPMTRGEFVRALGVFLTSHPDFFVTSLKPTLTVTSGKIQILNSSIITLGENQKYTLKAGDLVRSSQATSAEVNLPDGSGILIKENTALKLITANGRKYIKTDGTEGVAVEKLDIKLTQGKIFGALATNINETDLGATKVTSQLNRIFRDQNLLLASATISPKIKKSNQWWKQTKTKRVKVKIDMPWGLAAIKGTFWENYVDPKGRATTSLLTGLAEVTAGGKTVQVAVGQKTITNINTKTMSTPSAMNTEEKNDWIKVDTWATKKAREIEQNQEINLFYSKAKQAATIYDNSNIIYGTKQRKYILPQHQEVPGY